MTVVLHLTPAEYAHGRTLGQLRDRESRRQGLQQPPGGPEQGSSRAQFFNVMGGVGEVAVAKWLGLKLPDTVNTFKAPDLVIPLQVRTRPLGTSREKGDHLIVRDRDPDAEVYVLVHYAVMRCEIVGWCFGWEAKRPAYRWGYGELPRAWFVPPGALRSPETLLGGGGCREEPVLSAAHG